VAFPIPEVAPVIKTVKLMIFFFLKILDFHDM